ncbi:MAG: winged helix-turn-helix domain-containing protein [Planctomycetota bacterium]|jgi:DNA-binding LacI/PurR family transcriptional regulator|nr:winged helix-turn-helix domain-containing protein [Planctomycetota bacterium]
MAGDGGGKRDEVSDALRAKIRNGSYPPGERLPTVREVAAEFNTSVLTVHRALQELVEDGFIVTDGRRGTRVVEHPPHLCRYGLIVGEDPRKDGSYRTANLAASTLAASAWDQPNSTVVVYRASNTHPEPLEHQRLINDLTSGRLAGLILHACPAVGSWLRPRELTIPVVGMPPDKRPPHWGGLHFIHVHFLDRAIDELAKTSIKRFAVLQDAAAAGITHAEGVLKRAAAKGLDCRPERILCAPVNNPQWVLNVVTALMQGPADDRPEALVIGDDNLLPAASAALDTLGFAPDQCALYSMANFPYRTPSSRAVVRIGWDHEEFLRRAVALIDRYNRDQTPIGDHAMAARPESEHRAG